MICVPTVLVLAVALLATSTTKAQEQTGINGVATTSSRAAKDCRTILAANGGGDDQQDALLCQLSESSQLLAQLGGLVSEGVERLIQNRGLALEDDETNDESPESVEKRKHEYLRFGKRKHEYLRFGKRKHEYLRFGKRKHEYLRFGRK